MSALSVMSMIAPTALPQGEADVAPDAAATGEDGVFAAMVDAAASIPDSNDPPGQPATTLNAPSAAVQVSATAAAVFAVVRSPASAPAAPAEAAPEAGLPLATDDPVQAPPADETVKDTTSAPASVLPDATAPEAAAPASDEAAPLVPAPLVPAPAPAPMAPAEGEPVASTPASQPPAGIDGAPSNTPRAQGLDASLTTPAAVHEAPPATASTAPSPEAAPAAAPEASPPTAPTVPSPDASPVAAPETEAASQTPGSRAGHQPAVVQAVVEQARPASAPLRAEPRPSNASVADGGEDRTSTDHPASSSPTDGARRPAVEGAPVAASAGRPARAEGAPAPTAAAAAPVEAVSGEPAAPQPTLDPQGAAPVDRAHGLSSLSRATIETTAQIAAQILRRLDGRSTRFDMALTPEDLGRVDVRLEIDSEGRLAARLAFDNPAAAADLRGRADELRRQLQDAGFQLSQDSLDFAERDASSGFGGGGFDRAPDRRAFLGAAEVAASADAAILPPPGAWVSLSLTPDRVDLKV